jgi:hypothetical protein
MRTVGRNMRLENDLSELKYEESQKYCLHGDVSAFFSLLERINAATAFDSNHLRWK